METDTEDCWEGFRARRAAVETQLVKDKPGKRMIARTCEDEGNEDARTRTTTNTTTETTNASNNKREI